MLGVCNDCLRETSLLRASEQGKRTRGKHVPFLIEREKSLRHVAMVAKFLDLNKPKSKWGVIFCRFPYPILPPPVLFRPLVTRLTPFIVFLLYHVNHAVWLPILTGSALALSKIKNGFVNRTTSYSPARSLKRHSFDTTLHHTAKSSMFCELESYGSSSQEGLPYGRIFAHHTEESETDQNGLWRHFIWLALLFLRRISTASETDETVTRLTQ